MRRFLAVFLVVLLSPMARSQELADRADLLAGTLDNGVKYVVLQHDNPPGRVALWLHVSTGSLNETDRQRGIAHFLEHMAFNGSEHFAPGDVVPYFESIGMTFGRDQNAWTSFDQTNYMLYLPDNKPETLDKGMLFLSDVAMRLSLLQEEIDNERGVILQEKRARLGVMQRVGENVISNLAPGSIVGQRIPIGTEETIKNFTRDDFVDYYSHWYVPANMTIIAVADMEPAAVAEAIKRNFSDGDRIPIPPDHDAGVKPYEESRALIVTDSELTRADVAIDRIEPAREPVATMDRLRDDLVEQIGLFAFNRRLNQRIAEGSAAFRSGNISVSDFFRAATLSELRVSGDEDQWREMLADACEELQRARVHGFTTRELDDARAEFLSQARHAVEVESTADARWLLSQIAGAVAADEPISSAEQDLQWIESLLPGITAEEVSAHFAEQFDPSAVTFLLQVPADADVPGDDELVTLGTVLLDIEPEPIIEEARPDQLMAKAPAPGKVLDLTEHEASGVWSAWLDNNIRVHHRYSDYREDEVTVMVTLAGGEILEDESNRGVSQAAAIPFQRHATSNLNSTNIRDLMTGKNISVRGGASTDMMFLRITGDPDDLEPGLQLAHLLLADPVIEPAAFEQWKQAQIQGIEARKLSPDGALLDLWHDSIYPPDEPRLRLLTKQDIDRLTIEQAQHWLDKTLALAPVEVAVIGDIDRDRAMELVATYLGSLPSRPRIGPDTYAELRHVSRPTGPITRSRTVATATNKAVVLAGCYGSDESNVRDTRLISLASRILSTRMVKQLREDEQLVYSINVRVFPAVEYPGFGLIFAFSWTEPASADALGSRIHEMFASFAADGPTADEMTVAKSQAANDLDKQMREPWFWTGRLSRLTYRGRSLDDVMAAPKAYQAITADEITEAFNRYYREESKILLTVTPEAGKETTN
jgi:zinc protease